MSKIINLSGQRFGSLLVIKLLNEKRGKYRLWECLCDCGRKSVVRTGALNSKKIRSCGCQRRKSLIKHGDSGREGKPRTRLYRIWVNMKSRCGRIERRNYKNYGGRGIKVCKTWLNSFMSFRTWALANEYTDNLTIDRINNDGNYEPGNCQWLTRAENRKKGNA